MHMQLFDLLRDFFCVGFDVAIPDVCIFVFTDDQNPQRMKEEATLKFTLRLMPDIDGIRGGHSTLHRERQRIFPLSGLRYSLEQLSRRAAKPCTR